MRGVISLVIAVLALGSAQAQRPFIEYLGEVPGMGTYDLFTNPDSTLSFVGWDNFSGSTVISKVDTNGNLIWQQANPNGCGSRYMTGMPSKNGGYYVLKMQNDCWGRLYVNMLGENGEFIKSVKLWNEKLNVSSQFYLNYFKETDSTLYVLVNSGNGNTTIEKIDLQDSIHVGYKLLPELEDRSFSSKHYEETDRGWLFTLNDGIYSVDTTGVVRQYQFLNNIDQYEIEGMIPRPNNNSIMAFGYEKYSKPGWNIDQRRLRLFKLDTATLEFEVIPIDAKDTLEDHDFLIKGCEKVDDKYLLISTYSRNSSSSEYYYNYYQIDSSSLTVEFDTSIDASQGYYTKKAVSLNGAVYATDFPSRVHKITPKSVLLNTEKSESDNNKLEVYPNPSKGNLNVELRGNSSIEKIQVYSLNGNLVRELNPGSNKTVITLEQAGVYLMKIITDSGVYNRKVIKL